MLELYTSEPNGFFLKPLIALAEAQATYTTHYFDAEAFAQFEPGFPADVESQLQLEREGPLLRHEGALISSSFFMLEYLADIFPDASLMPRDPYDAYRARAWGQLLGLQLGAIVPQLGCQKYLRPRLLAMDPRVLETHIAAIEPQERRAGWQSLVTGAGLATQVDALRERLRAPLARVERALAASPWLAGAAHSIADIDAYAMLRVVPDLAPGQLNDSVTPHIVAWLARMAERPAVRTALQGARTPNPEQHFVPGMESARWG